MITELEFKSLAAQGYNRIPLLTEAFADLETPLSLYLKLAYADGVADPSEVRVVRAFADAWGVSQDEVDHWLETWRAARRSRQQRLLDRLRSFFLAG